MADVYLDEHVAEDLALLLEATGHDVMTTRQLRSKAQNDAKQLLTASRLSRVFITHNGKDFVLLHSAWRQWGHEWSVSTAFRHPGILIIPQPPRLPTPDAVDVLSDFLRGSHRQESSLYDWKSRLGWRQTG
ncbi:MAG: DUF5615 family PIN-like protein [Thermomicrobiales bacterium]